MEKHKDCVIIGVRERTLRAISGALINTINKHGPINRQFVGSAAKRIYGAIQNVLESK